MSKLQILSGQLKNRAFGEIVYGVRPVSQKLRASIFQTISGRAEDADVVDLYAGAGTLGFEALSQGARHCIFVEASPTVVRILQRSAIELHLVNQTKIIHQKVKYFVQKSVKNNRQFDIIFCDPPYDKIDFGLVKQATNLLQSDGILVLSCSKRTDISSVVPLIVLQKRFGDSRVLYLKRDSE